MAIDSSSEAHAITATARDIIPVGLLLRLEGLATAILSVVAYSQFGRTWWLFALLFLAPDLSALGYLAGTRVGAVVYNIAHCYALPAALIAAGILADDSLVLSIGMIWGAHIGFDRMLGYGLKLAGGFKQTHLAGR